MDEEYDNFMWKVEQDEGKKPVGERNPRLAEDIKLNNWWHRKREGRPVESKEEEEWRKNCDTCKDVRTSLRRATSSAPASNLTGTEHEEP